MKFVRFRKRRFNPAHVTFYEEWDDAPAAPFGKGCVRVITRRGDEFILSGDDVAEFVARLDELTGLSLPAERPEPADGDFIAPEGVGNPPTPASDVDDPQQGCV